jgi:hypothetical protein
MMKISALVLVGSGRSVLDGLVLEWHVAGRSVMSLLRWTVMPSWVRHWMTQPILCIYIPCGIGLHCKNIHLASGYIHISCRADTGRTKIRIRHLVHSKGQINGNI